MNSLFCCVLKIPDINVPLRLLFVHPAFSQDSARSSHTLTYLSFLWTYIHTGMKDNKEDRLHWRVSISITWKNHCILLAKIPYPLILAVYHYCFFSCELRNNKMLTRCSPSSVKIFFFSIHASHNVAPSFFSPLKDATHIPCVQALQMDWDCIEV